MLSANQIEEIKEQAFIGAPSQLANVCKVYPFTMKDIIEMGTSSYNGKLGILLLGENDIANMINEKAGQEVDPSTIVPLHYLLQSAELNDAFSLELQNIFSTFLREDILLLPRIKAVLVGSPAERRLITAENFPDLQDILRIQNRKEVKEAPPKDESAGQRKMRLLREKVAEVKKKQAQKKGEVQELSDLLEIASVFGIDLEKTTLYAFYGLVRRFQLREKWDQDIRMLCAGADSKKIKPKYWGESSKNE